MLPCRKVPTGQTGGSLPGVQKRGMKMKKARRLIKGGMLGKLFLTYLCVLVFPLVFSVVLYVHTARLLTEEAKERNGRSLEQSRIMMEGHIREMELLITRLADNNHVLQFMNLKDPQLPERIGLITGLWKDFSSISFADGTVEEFYIWFKGQDCIITPDAIYSTTEYYRSYVEGVSGLSYEEWQDIVTSKETYISYGASYSIKKRGVVCPIMDFSLSLPFGSGANLEASIHVLLSQKSAQLTMAQLDGKEEDEYYIFTSDGIPVTGKPGKSRPQAAEFLPEGKKSGYFTRSFDGEEMLISFERSAKNGWIYLSLQPMKGILSQTEDLRNIFLIMLAVCVGAGCMIAICLSWWISVPIRKMLRQVRAYRSEAATAEKGDMVVLENAIHRLMDENEYVQREIQKHLPILRNNFAVKLLQGQADSEQEIELGMEQAGISLFGRRFAVVLIYISGYKGAVSKEILMELSAAKAVIHGLGNMNQLLSLALEADLEERTVAYVVPFKETEEAQCAKKLLEAAREIQDGLFRLVGVHSVCFTGRTVNSISRVDLSYQDARQKMDRYSISGEMADGDPNGEDKGLDSHYSYSMETEMRLMLICREGKWEEVSELLNAVYEDNIRTRRLDRESLILLLGEIKGTIYKLLNSIVVPTGLKEEIYSQLEAQRDCDFDQLGSIFQTLCGVVKENKSHQSEQLKEELEAYINARYADNEFYLVTLAEHFNLSESFLSAFIKENFKVNFSTYVQDLRMAKACYLLGSTQMSIDSISAKTGYSSSHVFRRAFKRQYGVNPNQYREYVQEKKGQ